MRAKRYSMYSGTTFRIKSGRVIGVHQKIDRVARRHVRTHVPESLHFPTSQEILHFEGLNGPDGIKRKSPAKDEPWHYIDPKKPLDRALLVMINDHIHNLAVALKKDDQVRAAFEAAWLSHAVVDGLTPAHHYPLSDKIEELWGKVHTERITIKDKNIIHGKNRRDTISKNWEYWGTGGVFTAHIMFEWGVATTIAPQKFNEAGPTEHDYKLLENEGYEAIFLESLHKVDDMGMYDEFGRKGWTRHLANETRKVLIPEIVKAVTLAWYQAVLQAKKPS